MKKKHELVYRCRVIFALMAVVNLFLFFVDGFPNYGNASLCAASAMAAYLIHSKLCRSQS